MSHVVCILCPEDLVTVLEELIGACAKWENIGLKLGLTSGILAAIKGPYKEPQACLRDMLREWLSTGLEPSWQSLVQVLRSPIVSEETLARVIEVKYCNEVGSQPFAGNSYVMDALVSLCTFLQGWLCRISNPLMWF